MLVGEVRVLEHEVEEARRVVAEVHAVGISLSEDRRERFDAVRVGIEMLDVEAIAADARAGVGDRADVVEVVAVAHVGDHDPLRIDACLHQRVEREQPRLRRRVRMHHHRHAGLDGRRGDDGEDARHVGDDPVLLDGALEERGLDASVVDAFADLADEELDQRVVAAIGEEARQLEKGVDAARHDDVQVDLGIDPLDARDIAAEPRSGRVDDRADPTVSQALQLRDGVGDANLLVPVARAPGVPVVLERLLVEDENVLVHERRTEVGEPDRPEDGLDGVH